MTVDRTSTGHHAKRAVRATLWSAINSVIPIITNLGVFVAVARVLTPHDFGEVAFAIGLALIGAAFCPGGLGEAIIQRLEISERQLSSVFWLCMASALVVYGLECALAATLAKFFKMEILAVLIPVISTRILADMAAVVPNALLARAMSFHLIAMRTFIVSLIAASITIGLLVAGFGIWALVVSQLAASYVVMLVSFLAIKWHPRFMFSVAAVKELLGYGLFSSGTQTLSRVFQQNEQILVGLILGTTQLGFYNFSKQVLGVFNNVVAGSLGAVAHPMFSGIQNDRERVKKGFLSATFVSSLVAFPMFTGLALVAPHIVPLAFGASWLQDVPLIQLQCAFGLATCIGTLQAGLITSQGKANWWFYYQLAVTLSTALTIILFARFGLAVMLFAMVVKTYVMWMIPVRNTLTLMAMPAKQYLFNFRTPAFATIAMALMIEAVNSLFPGQSNLQALVLDMIMGIAVYGIVAFTIDANRIGGFIALITPKLRKAADARPFRLFQSEPRDDRRHNMNAKPFVKEFEGLRGILAAWVVLGHAFVALPVGRNQHLGSLMNVDAVDVFIILSGFVIFTLLGNRPDLPYLSYLTGRFFRIFPVYFCVLVLSTLMLQIDGHILLSSPAGTASALRLTEIAAAARHPITHFIAHLTMLQGIIPEHLLPYSAFTLVGQAWSISVEWQFYLIAPLLFAWMSTIRTMRSVAGLLAVLAISVIYSRYVTTGFFGANLATFAIGFASYFFYRSNFTALPMRSVNIFFVSLFCLGVLFAHRHSLGISIWLVVFYAVVSARRSSGGKNFLTKFLMLSPTSYLGRISYSVYLVHMQVLFGLMWCFHAANVPLAIQYVALPIGCLLAAIAVASVLHHTIEAPCHEFGKRLTSIQKRPIHVRQESLAQGD